MVTFNPPTCITCVYQPYDECHTCSHDSAGNSHGSHPRRCVAKWGFGSAELFLNLVPLVLLHTAFVLHVHATIIHISLALLLWPSAQWGLCSAELFLHLVSLVLFTPLLLIVHTYITHILMSPLLWPVAEWGLCSAELFLNLVSFFELCMTVVMPRSFTKKNGDFVLQNLFSQSCYHCHC